MENILENTFTQAQLDFYEKSRERKKHDFAMKLIENHKEKAMASHLKNRELLFAVGEPFYTELAEDGMYKRESPNGEVHAVRRHFFTDGKITDEIINDYPL